MVVIAACKDLGAFHTLNRDLGVSTGGWALMDNPYAIRAAIVPRHASGLYCVPLSILLSRRTSCSYYPRSRLRPLLGQSSGPGRPTPCQSVPSQRALLEHDLTVWEYQAHNNKNRPVCQARSYGETFLRGLAAQRTRGSSGPSFHEAGLLRVFLVERSWL